MNLIAVTPEKSDLMGSRDLSQQIIQELMKPEPLNLVGIGTSISLVISAVNVSKAIANVNVHSICLDYIPMTNVYRPEAIFFELQKTPADIPRSVQTFENQFIDDKNARTVGIRRSDRVETATNIILWKLNKYDALKVMASGFAIMTAIRSTLQVTTSGIAKNPVGITGILAESIERSEGSETAPKKVPAIQIYLEKGQPTAFPTNHREVIENIIQR